MPKSRNVIITGASQGIGKALAYEFARRGDNLLMLARDTDALKEICQNIYNSGGLAYYQKCDVTSAEDMKNAIEYAIKIFGTIDLALLNSGVSLGGWFDESIAEIARKTFEVNYFGVLNGLDAIIPLMKRQGYGTIAGVSSLSDFRGLPGSAAYTSSKVAVTYLLEAARIELKKYGIKIVTIKPGFVKTPMTARHKYKMPFLWEAEKAAKYIADKLERNKTRISFPLPIKIITYLVKILPGCIFDKIGFFIMKETEKNKQ